MTQLFGSTAAGSVSDPLAGLLSLPGVSDELAQTRAAIDRVRGQRNVWRARPEVAAASRALGSWANAALEGVAVPLEQFLNGEALDTSPQGSVLAGACALTAAAPRLASLVSRVPAQVITELAVLAGTAMGGSHDPDLGRPRGDYVTVDPLHIGPPPGPAEVRGRLTALSAILRTSAVPGLLVAAIAHAELAWIRPFRVGAGLSGRALDRVVLAQRGVDPDLLTTPELGIWQAGRSAYVRALQGYAAATPAGVGEWISFYCRAVVGQAGAAAEMVCS